jgi:hypothetical protein
MASPGQWPARTQPAPELHRAFAQTTPGSVPVHSQPGLNSGGQGRITATPKRRLGMTNGAQSHRCTRATGPRRGHVSSTCDSRTPGNRKAILTCMAASPQISHKSGSTAWFPTESPWTKGHSPAQGGTAASMALLALTSLYAGSAGLTILELPVVRAVQTF